jgi:hypothetical protein
VALFEDFFCLSHLLIDVGLLFLNGLWAKFQDVSIYSKLNLSSSLTSDENFLIKPSNLLTFILIPSSAPLFIYVFILYLLSLFMFFIRVGMNVPMRYTVYEMTLLMMDW